MVPTLGGLAVVASFVKPDQHDFLRKLGVGDSKTLTDQKIRHIAPLLKEKSNIKHYCFLRVNIMKSLANATMLFL